MSKNRVPPLKDTPGIGPDLQLDYLDSVLDYYWQDMKASFGKTNLAHDLYRTMRLPLAVLKEETWMIIRDNIYVDYRCLMLLSANLAENLEICWEFHKQLEEREQEGEKVLVLNIVD